MTWTRTKTTTPVRPERIAIEIPDRLSDPARRAIGHQLDEWTAHPGRPLVLDDGARIRSIDSEGRVTPNDEVVIRLAWWAFVLGAASGAIVTMVAGALT